MFAKILNNYGIKEIKMKRTLTKKEKLEWQIQFYKAELIRLQKQLVEVQKELEEEQKVIKVLRLKH